MKKIAYVILMLIASWSSLRGQTVPVPDPDFLSFLKANYPSTIDTADQLIIAEAAKVTGKLNCSFQNISDAEGLQYFTGINSLDISNNNLATIPEISALTNVKTLHLESNQLTALPPLSQLVKLQKLIVHDNLLTGLPDLSADTSLTQIIVYNNQLISLPDLSTLKNLQKLDAGNNQLVITPDLRKDTSLKDVYLDRNFLTKGPDLSGLNNLTSVQLHSNYLSFEDLLPYTAYPGFTSNFTIQPQKKFSLSNQEFFLKDTLELSTHMDTSLTGISYQWYHNNSALGAVSNDSLILYPAGYSDTGYYYCVLTCQELPGVQLMTNSLKADLIYCPADSNFSFDYQGINCTQSGRVIISLNPEPSKPYTFYLVSSVTGDSLKSTNGFFEHLNEPEYKLSLYVTPGCQVTLKAPIYIPYEECKEAFITPNGDGDKDTYFFEQTGKATIYNKNGMIVQTLTLPTEWDGTSRNGQRLAQGYYAVNINDGAEYITISILY